MFRDGRQPFWMEGSAGAKAGSKQPVERKPEAVCSWVEGLWKGSSLWRPLPLLSLHGALLWDVNTWTAGLGPVI